MSAILQRHDFRANTMPVPPAWQAAAPRLMVALSRVVVMACSAAPRASRAFSLIASLATDSSSTAAAMVEMADDWVVVASTVA